MTAFLSLDIVVQTKAGGFGVSYPRFLLCAGNANARLHTDAMLLVAGKAPQQFNDFDVNKIKRTSRVPVRVRACCVTVLDERRLILASKITPDDRLEHWLLLFRQIVNSQLRAEHPAPACVYVDDVKKFAPG